ncbi:A52R-family [Tanapox virus]|uniref:A52R-family n=1 Tax=Tanapox virus TaxID=99000 RepID=A7XCS7_9POXV|nr:A52R-family [Tanapox virus]ABQ43770.1 A52R-family [Tanapox virus]
MIKITVSDKKVTIESNNEFSFLLTHNNGILNNCNFVNNIEKSYLLNDEIQDSDNIFNIISNYLWYRGFIGLEHSKCGRLFKELLRFDLEAKRKYGSVKTIFNILNLDSNNGIFNLKKFILLQKTITKDFNVYHCIEIIGLCGIIVEEWKKMGRYLNWLNISNNIFKAFGLNVFTDLKKFLQNRLLYEELI